MDIAVGAVEVKLYQAVDDHNLDLAAGRCDAILADVGSIIDFMESARSAGEESFTFTDGRARERTPHQLGGVRARRARRKFYVYGRARG